MSNWQGAGGSYGSQLASRKNASEEYHSNKPEKKDGGGGLIVFWISVIIAFLIWASKN